MSGSDLHFSKVRFY